jgi:hypothetical protein
MVGSQVRKGLKMTESVKVWLVMNVRHGGENYMIESDFSGVHIRR